MSGSIRRIPATTGKRRPESCAFDQNHYVTIEQRAYQKITTRATYKTDPKKCHVSHVVADTDTWEQKLAQTLEEMDEVLCYVKNQNLGFFIPYTIDGSQRNYMPDFLARIDDGHGRDDPLNLIIEVTGDRDRDKAAKVSTARTLWVPAVNNAGTWGRWAFIEITDPWDAKNAIRSFLTTHSKAKELATS